MHVSGVRWPTQSTHLLLAPLGTLQSGRFWRGTGQAGAGAMRAAGPVDCQPNRPVWLLGCPRQCTLVKSSCKIKEQGGAHNLPLPGRDQYGLIRQYTLKHVEIFNMT